jgi:hypothetical protein
VTELVTDMLFLELPVQFPTDGSSSAYRAILARGAVFDGQPTTTAPRKRRLTA